MAKMLKMNKFQKVNLVALISIALIVMYTMSNDDLSDEIRLAVKNQAAHANPHDLSDEIRLAVKNQAAHANPHDLSDEIRLAVKNQAAHANPHDFKYLINPGNKICGGDSSPTLLALVVTAPGNFERRSLVRKTWANKKYSYMKVVFMMGDSSNKIVNERVMEESERFKDIVQESFHDTYENLTLKSVMIFKWSAEYCPLAKAFMKVDDDVYVHSYKLGQYLNSALVQAKDGGLNGPQLRNTFICKVQRNAPADRNSTNKWYVSYEEYRHDIFVTYCGGPAYVFTSDLSGRLYEQSLKTKLIRLEDVYTGVLATKLDADFIELKSDDGEYLFKHQVRDLYREWLVDEHLIQF